MIAIIGGSSLSQPPGLAITHRQVVHAIWRAILCLDLGWLAARWCFWRHGHGHMHAPMKSTTAPIYGR